MVLTVFKRRWDSAQILTELTRLACPNHDRQPFHHHIWVIQKNLTHVITNWRNRNPVIASWVLERWRKLTHVSLTTRASKTIVWCAAERLTAWSPSQVRGVTSLDGARGEKHIWRSHVRTKFFRKQTKGGNSSVVKVRLPIGRLGVRSTATEWIAVALLGQKRSPQPPRQEANSKVRPAANWVTKINKKKKLKKLLAILLGRFGVPKVI